MAHVDTEYMGNIVGTDWLWEGSLWDRIQCERYLLKSWNQHLRKGREENRSGQREKSSCEAGLENVLDNPSGVGAPEIEWFFRDVPNNQHLINKISTQIL